MIVLISGASSGFGALTARALVDAGHLVYAGMRDLAGRNATAAADATAYSPHLRALELDVSSEASVQQAVDAVVREQGRIDVLIHNAGHMVTGPSEAFTPEQILDIYDTNVVGAQRLNRAALPVLRGQQDGLVVWVGSSSTRGGTPPYLGPYFAAKAGMDALAATYALELARFGIETTIVVPGAFTHGTNHFLHSGSPSDTDVVAAYETKYAGLMDQVGQRLADLEPEWSDVGEVAKLIVSVVETEKGKRPFRASYDPSDDGAVVVNAVADRVRSEFLHRIGLEDLLHPTA
ncbi:SDR family oxidoreductase [Kribbella sandramycini]|uniref:NAD(P)-dependent dehydrogenase (Short-subunit alcohol dehydrogenase family) n=1 Tax=Kribbella sandramycini TaxID=60450 RepID=A0A7Y4L2F8_9ACTN|nr:SDR family oxidoreductase [Kribbella sandramycini]MBB6566208.1 NAD(P)-dependent dehydrogenase (short-subunit alcohol dehydrogenase family) [Kribbella sandramycini]NOL43125.1 SDR family oxidoreductase [Kribbella sandramycini]